MINGEEESKKTKMEIGNLYDINKQLVEQYEKEIPNEMLQEKKRNIIDFLNITNNRYYMLLCNDRKDYTIFSNINDKLDEITNILVDECLKNRGIIKGIAQTEDKGAIEIWLSIDGESYCYYFFPYDSAIIEV